jgi:phytoene synthase
MTDPVVALARERIAKGSKSFALAARLFRPETRDDAMLLYAWCRHCDDEIDGQVLGYERRTETRPAGEILATLREQTVAAVRGRPSGDPVFIGLARVVERHAIPEVHPLDLIGGMAMDVEMEAGRRRYPTLEPLAQYCYHVAGVVGVMMAHVMGVREPAVLRRASDLGIAFQMTNIVRDVVADAEMGRCYLPEDWLGEAGLSPATVAAPAHRRALHGVANRLLTEADRYYTSAEAGVPHLPFRSAWAIAAARRVYRDIGTVVRARGPAAWDTRTSTGTVRKLAGVAFAAGDAARTRGRRHGLAESDRTGLWTPPTLTAERR